MRGRRPIEAHEIKGQRPKMSPMTVYETDLPGVGRKYELTLPDDARAVVVVHHDGRREVFRRASPEEDSKKVFDLDAPSARQFAAILQGTGFETVDVNDLQAPLGEAIIEWVEVGPDSELVGQTIGEADLRAQTGVSILAIQRSESAIEHPDADTELLAGDILVGLGSREEHAALDELL